MHTPAHTRGPTDGALQRNAGLGGKLARRCWWLYRRLDAKGSPDPSRAGNWSVARRAGEIWAQAGHRRNVNARITHAFVEYGLALVADDYVNMPESVATLDGVHL